MADIATIDHDLRCERAWGVLIGTDHYRADVVVQATGNQEPPAFMAFTLRPIPVAGIRLDDWFVVGATPAVARMSCDLLSAHLVRVDADEYAALAPVPEPVEEPPALSAEDFAGPNRAQRRAARRPRKRR